MVPPSDIADRRVMLFQVGAFGRYTFAVATVIETETRSPVMPPQLKVVAGQSRNLEQKSLCPGASEVFGSKLHRSRVGFQVEITRLANLTAGTLLKESRDGAVSILQEAVQPIADEVGSSMPAIQSRGSARGQAEEKPREQSNQGLAES